MGLTNSGVQTSASLAAIELEKLRFSLVHRQRGIYGKGVGLLGPAAVNHSLLSDFNLSR